AREALRRGHHLGTRSPGWGYDSAGWLRQCERLLKLDEQLSDVLAGKAPPASPKMQAEFAMVCVFKRQYRTATRFYEEAFADQPGLLAGLRFGAACAAVPAGCGQGQDAVKP